jgi:hypothetical protein
MKISGVIGVLAIAAGAATANADYIFTIGNNLLAGGASVQQTAALTGTLTSFDYSVNFQPDATAQSNGSWCSDAAVAIMAPGSGNYQWGGYDVLFGTSFVAFWSFDGPGSAPVGPYADTRTDVNAALNGTGTWQVTFGNGYSASSPVQYNSVTVTLHGVSAVPAPASAALLGFAGLGLTRRRRR